MAVVGRTDPEPELLVSVLLAPFNRDFVCSCFLSHCLIITSGIWRMEAFPQLWDCRNCKQNASRDTNDLQSIEPKNSGPYAQVGYVVRCHEPNNNLSHAL